MAMGHRATASPVALLYGWALYGGGAGGLAAVGGTVLVVASSTLPDWDHPRFKGRMHPGAALVRGTGHIGYMIRTDRDKDREDFHRGPSHCVEWCVLAGLMTALLVSRVPALAGWPAVWLGLAVTLGTVTHIVADLCTPSGVPVCATWNYFRHGEVWRRHSWGLFSTDSAGERFLAVPLLFGLSGLIGLGIVGLLGPALSALTGIG